MKYPKFFVKMLGWYFSGKNICIAMEYFAEGDLDAYLQDRPPLDEQNSQQIISQVL